MIKKSLILVIVVVLISCSKSTVSHSRRDLLIGEWVGEPNEFNPPDESPVIFLGNGRVEWVYLGQGNSGEDVSEHGEWVFESDTINITWDEADPGLFVLKIQVIDLTESRLEWMYEAPTGEFTQHAIYNKVN